MRGRLAVTQETFLNLLVGFVGTGVTIAVLMASQRHRELVRVGVDQALDRLERAGRHGSAEVIGITPGPNFVAPVMALDNFEPEPERPRPDLDERFIWEEITTLGSATPEYVKVGCNHLNVVPVEAHPTGEVVAYLCTDCDGQLRIT
jgi:hypothetical protein